MTMSRIKAKDLWNDPTITERSPQIFKQAKELSTQLLKVKTVVDKIRYACDNTVEKDYIKELLGMFHADSGEFKDE